MSFLDQKDAAASTIHIGGFSSSHHDDFYRYTMPAVKCSKGRRNETAITNLEDIAKALQRTPQEVLKYVSAELGTSGSHSNRIDQYVLKGEYHSNVVQDKINQFSESYVVCQVCRDPGTRYDISQKHQVIYLECGACGALEPVDMNHKVCKHILNQRKKLAKGEKQKKQKQKRTQEAETEIERKK